MIKVFVSLSLQLTLYQKLGWLTTFSIKMSFEFQLIHHGEDEQKENTNLHQQLKGSKSNLSIIELEISK